ncbi:MAG TPA: hypothetical protein VMF30_06935 [Pirellulales bacterium]|nr:hypothetical protein [Pirellulales bacterium]
MSGFYRFEFVQGPLDGLAVEGNTMYSPRLRLPNQAEGKTRSPGTSADARRSSVLYELINQSLRWEEGGPQAVLRYEFRGLPPHDGQFRRLRGWLQTRRRQLAAWLLAPVSYPMTTRSK